jgi:hypothetical protein
MTPNQYNRLVLRRWVEGSSPDCHHRSISRGVVLSSLRGCWVVEICLWYANSQGQSCCRAFSDTNRQLATYRAAMSILFSTVSPRS